MAFDPAIFKAYDVRGVYPTQIDEQAVEKIGRAYVAPMNSRESPLVFHTMDFEYDTEELKNGNTAVTITPKNQTKYPRQMYLTIYRTGYGTLQVTSFNRDPIGFTGYIRTAD